MVLYNFKKIQVVPPAGDFIDIVLSRTQRKTPTVIHRHYAIANIRKFYMRKIKYTQQTYHDKLTHIIDDFPLLDDIHPFYADLLNVLYDRDHYKLALGQINTARHLIDNLGKDYIRMLKFGDSLYRCKQLKRAAMGRMCTIMKKQTASLAYLEQVRQHLARLPSIDPNTRTLILCGYPNVGKSSFMNKLTKADVDVQPYAFTTKSLFVGHTDYKYLRWQVLDTPGILDHPLAERNTIEMLSITALAHLQASIVYLIDISEQCGYSIEEQVKLFESIRPLFVNKPLVIGLNKIDVVTPENLREDAKQLLMKLKEIPGVELIPMSTHKEEGVSKVKETACERLLAKRIDEKMGTLKRDDLLAKVNVAMPVARDNVDRPATIPLAVFQKRQQKMEDDNLAVEAVKVKTEIDDMETDAGEKKLTRSELYEKWKGNLWQMADKDPNWDPTIFGLDWREQYDLSNEEWKFDSIPEILDGMNVMDWIDPDIMDKLKMLEDEENERLTKEELDDMREEEEGKNWMLSTEDEQALRELYKDRKMARIKHREETGKNKSIVPKKFKRPDLNAFESHLHELGIDPSAASERIKVQSRSRSKSRDRGRKRGRDEMEEDTSIVSSSKKRKGNSKTPQQAGLKDSTQFELTEEMAKKAQRRSNIRARKGEGDRSIVSLKPKHLFSGKRGNGTNQRR